MAAVLLSTLIACTPFKKPRIVAGGETTVTLEAGQWSETESFARDYCGQFGRRAVPRGTARISEDKLTSLFIYDCRDEKR